MDEDGGRFFMRMEFALAGLDVEPAELEKRFGREVAGGFEMDWRVRYSERRVRTAILVSRFDHCLLELLWRWRRGELPIDLRLVISNHDRLRGDVEGFGVPYQHLPVTKEARAEQEAAIVELCAGQDIELIVLARYMQVLSPDVTARYPNRIINIHHSFLPAFAGADPYGRAFERGVKLIGATAHYATNDLDEGPIIEQDVGLVSHRDSREGMIRLGREVERSVLARAVEWHIEDRVFVHGNKTIVFR
jgi:formyltetrahydrofolate deformylase